MDPIKAVQGIYQAEDRVPSIRQLVKAGVRKAEIYEKYGGLKGLCEAAGVPLPRGRYERVGAAMSRRVEAPLATEEKTVESIYKVAPDTAPIPSIVQPQPMPQAPAYAQPYQQLPQAIQPRPVHVEPQQPHPPQPAQSPHVRDEDLRHPPSGQLTKEETLTKGDLLEALIELSKSKEAPLPTAKPEVEAPPKPFKKQIEEILEGHFRELRRIEKGEAPPICAVRESGERIEKLIGKIEMGELYPKQKEVPQKTQAPLSLQQPSEPPALPATPSPAPPAQPQIAEVMPQVEKPPVPQPVSTADVDQLIRQAKETAREIATKRALEYFEAKEKAEHEPNEKAEEEKQKKEELEEEKPKLEEVSKEELPEELPVHRDIFPIFKRRLRLLE